MDHHARWLPRRSGTGERVLDVLLMDDDPTAAQRLVATLRSAGLAVRSVRSGRVGLAQARRDPPDLVIVALALPDLTGFEASRLLREDPRTATVPIVVLAPPGDGSSRVAAYSAGADSVLTRPVEVDELLAASVSLGLRRRASTSTSPRAPGRRAAALDATPPGGSVRRGLAYDPWAL